MSSQTYRHRRCWNYKMRSHKLARSIALYSLRVRGESRYVKRKRLFKFFTSVRAVDKRYLFIWECLTKQKLVTDYSLL
jgi:hypothetical protein